jgi:hypothetical protein
MNYEQLIEAKVRMTEIDATAGICFGAVILFTAAVLVLIAKVRKEGFSEAPWLCGALVFVFFGSIITGSNIYKLCTAEIQARADLANYNLVELKKQ